MERRDRKILTLNDMINSSVDDANKIYQLERLQNVNERKKYARLTFILVVAWLSITSVIVVLNGTGSLHLSDTVLSVLLGGSMITVCAFLNFVMKYLFNVET